MYKPIRSALENCFNPIGKCKLYITADRIPESVKRILTDYVVLILKTEKQLPDLLGFVSIKKGERTSRRRIVVEVKAGELRLEDIYQVKRYAEILKAKYAFLIADARFDEARRRFLKNTPAILQFHAKKKGKMESRPITVLRFKDKSTLIRDKKICPLDPFDPSISWP